MQIRLSFKRMFLAPGKTFAVPTVAGARVRVVDGLVWATTSSTRDDVWLRAGDEHTVQSPATDRRRIGCPLDGRAHSARCTTPLRTRRYRSSRSSRTATKSRFPARRCNIAAHCDDGHHHRYVGGPSGKDGVRRGTRRGSRQRDVLAATPAGRWRPARGAVSAAGADGHPGVERRGAADPRSVIGAAKRRDYSGGPAPPSGLRPNSPRTRPQRPSTGRAETDDRKKPGNDARPPRHRLAGDEAGDAADRPRPIGRGMERRERQRRAGRPKVAMKSANDKVRSRGQDSGSAAKTPIAANTVPSTTTRIVAARRRRRPPRRGEQRGADRNAIKPGTALMQHPEGRGLWDPTTKKSTL